LLGDVLTTGGLTMRGRGLFDPLFGVDVDRPGSAPNLSRLSRLLSITSQLDSWKITTTTDNVSVQLIVYSKHV